MNKLIQVSIILKLFFFGSVYYRFCITIFGLGVTLVAGDDIIWEFIIYFFRDILGYSEFGNNLKNASMFSQIFGVVVCFISIVIFVYFYRQEGSGKFTQAQSSIIKYWENGEDFTEEHDSWFDENPEKENSFYEIIKDENSFKAEKLQKLRLEWRLHK